MSATLERISSALPGYQLGEEIGRGGFGVVLSGMHLKLQRRVAIKQIPPNFATDAMVRRRFADEARLMATIDHPHVVPVYDYVEADDLCLLVMEYLPGGTVDGRFRKEGFDAASAIAVTLACAAGLHAAHQRGVLHRDIKPSNLMFSANGAVKLTDFGIAKIVGGDETLITKAGEVVGTLSYLAPEQARGQALSPATDVYALATTLYQLLSGVLPFSSGGDSMTLLFQHAYEEPPPLTKVAPGIPAPIADVVMRGLATDPKDRFPSAESFAVALGEPAADSWGTDWLPSVGIPVIGADSIVTAATGGTHQIPATRKIQTARRNVATTRVLPGEPLPQRAIRFNYVNRDDVAPVQRVVRLPSPRVPYAVAAVLAIMAVAIAMIGLGTPDRGGDLRPGAVTVAGVDPTTGDDIRLDMSKPVPITATAVDGDAVALAFTVAGQGFESQKVPLAASSGPPAAQVTVPVSPYLVAGHMTAKLTIFRNGIPTATYRFGMQSTQSALTTAGAGCVLVLALFSAAYVESYLRGLRRGRNRVPALVGLPLSAAALAVAVVGAAWVLLGHEPTVATLLGSATLGAAAGLAAVVGALRVGRQSSRRNSRGPRAFAKLTQPDRFSSNPPQYAPMTSRPAPGPRPPSPR